MKSTRGTAKTTLEDERPIAPVTIFDAAGRVVRVVPAAEFQHAAAAAKQVEPSGLEGALGPLRRRAPRPVAQGG